MHGRYKPPKDVFHYEFWRNNGNLVDDLTNVNDAWFRFYYPRNHKNIPNNENIYNLHFIFYGDYTDTLWALNNEIILDN